MDVDHKRVRRLRWRLVWIVVSLVGLGLATVPAVTYWYYQSRGRTLLAEQFDAVRATGKPLTTTECNDWHRDQSSDPAATERWQRALAPFAAPAYRQANVEVPIVVRGIDLPPLSQSFEPQDLAAVEEYLRRYRAAHQLLHDAAKDASPVRFSREFGYGIQLLLPEADQVRAATQSLHLEFQLLARSGDIDAVFENFETRIAIADTLRDDPILMSMTIRLAAHEATLDDLREYAGATTLEDKQLARLRAIARRIDVYPQLSQAMIAERVILMHSFRYSQELLAENNRLPLQTTDDVMQMRRPEDCAKALEIMSRLQTAVDGPPAQVLDAIDVAMTELRALAADSSRLTRWRFAFTINIIPGVNITARQTLRINALRDLTDVSLAARRYALSNDRRPTAINDLVPALIPAVPMDPFDEAPLRMRWNDDLLVLYSVGENRWDDGGQTSGPSSVLDIRVELAIPHSED